MGLLLRGRAGAAALGYFRGCLGLPWGCCSGAASELLLWRHARGPAGAPLHTFMHTLPTRVHTLRHTKTHTLMHTKTFLLFCEEKD